MHSQLAQSPCVRAPSIAINPRERSGSHRRVFHDNNPHNSYIERDYRHQDPYYGLPTHTPNVARSHGSQEQIDIAAGYPGVYGSSPAPQFRRDSWETETWRPARYEGPFNGQPYGGSIPGHFGTQVASPSGHPIINRRLSVRAHPQMMNRMGSDCEAYGLPPMLYPNSMPLGGMTAGSPLPAAGDYGRPKWVHIVKPDYRRACFKYGSADVPYASLPGGPLEGMPAQLSSQMFARM